MSPQRTLAQCSLDLLTRRLMERRKTAAEVADAFVSETHDAKANAGNADRLDSAWLIGTACGESFALAARAEETVREIDGALGRMTAGTYGYCDGCGEMIPYRRLKVLPATTTCVDCTSCAHSRRLAPAEIALT